MNITFINSFKSEWLKKKRSFSSWLVWIGALLIPVIMTCVFIIYPHQLQKMHAGNNFWVMVFAKSWETMSVLFLPMGIVLAVSLITQLEFKNNAWKQLHAMPVSFSTIYFSKLLVLLLMLLQLLVLFNVGIYLSTVIPSFFNSSIPFPYEKIDPFYFLKANGRYFVTSLPILALQYLLSMQFKNFLVPMATGLGLVTAGIIALSWKYVYMLPTTYTALNFLESATEKTRIPHLMWWSSGYFFLFILLGYILYFYKKDKG